jgi:CRP/FNR family transcriptional regulator, cyclic AMP receptor protein
MGDQEGAAGGAVEPVMAQWVDALGRVEAFAELSRDQLKEIAWQCDWRRFPAGSAIISLEDGGHDVCFLLDGLARVSNHTLLGGQVRLKDLEPGSYFGELSAIDGGPRSAEVSAVTDCDVALVSPEAFRRLLGQHPSLLVHVLMNMATMIRRANAQILSHATL